MTAPGRTPTEQSDARSASCSLAWTDLVLADVSLRVPATTQYRLDDPCGYDFGSVAGWAREHEKEAVFTALWRPLTYWRKSTPGDTESVPDMHREFRDEVLLRMRKDSSSLDVRRDVAGTFADGHPSNEVEVELAVRRRMRTHRLIRRQLLWTCPVTRRHLAFELSAHVGDKVLEDWWTHLQPFSCHPHEHQYQEATEEP